MGVNKVVFGAVSIMDISDSTVTPETLADGAVAYGADGERIIGEMKATGGGAAIVDVTALPETDIREDVFYRVLTGAMYYNLAHRMMDKCYIVETLPETGEPAVTPDMSEITVYYAKDTGMASGYLSPELAGAFGYPAGWYPAEALMAATGNSYGGIVGSLDEMTAEETFYLLIQNVVKYRNDEDWYSLQGIGWEGDNIGAERFNSLLNEASGGFSHAEGWNTTASGHSSHAEGSWTTASAHSSHAEGSDTTASGHHSHSEGSWTTASGNYSHAEGINTTASGKSQHVEGEYNILDEVTDQSLRGKYVHITGNGIRNSSRSNAHTLDWDGNAWYQGGIKVGGTGQDDENAVNVLTENDIQTIIQKTIEALPVYGGEIE